MIRSATPNDAPSAVPLIVEAIGSIAMILAGTKDRQQAMPILEQFFREARNRVSYENTLVLEEPATDLGLNNRIVGVAVSYDGSAARKLDEPLERAARLYSGSREYQIPTEAEENEFYLDTVSVAPNCQGKGYGKQLIEAVCERARKLERQRIGLLVDLTNPNAKRLYERLQFGVRKRKRLAGAEYFHMVRDL